MRFAPVAADGIAYSARHDPDETCYALFDGGAPCLEEVDRRTDLDADWFWTLAEVYRLGRPPA